MNTWESIKFHIEDFVENPDEYLDIVKKEWENIDPEDRAFFQAVLTAIPARWMAKRYWLRKGAPEWAAKGFASLGIAISLGPARLAFEERQRSRKNEAAERKRKFDSLFD